MDRSTEDRNETLVSDEEKVFILEDPIVREQVATILRRGIARAEAAGKISRPCQHCDQPIVRADDHWVHVAGERRGCRAASRSRLGAWDEKLKGKWQATPG